MIYTSEVFIVNHRPSENKKHSLILLSSTLFLCLSWEAWERGSNVLQQSSSVFFNISSSIIQICGTFEMIRRSCLKCYSCMKKERNLGHRGIWRMWIKLRNIISISLTLSDCWFGVSSNQIDGQTNRQVGS
jgi:hypothetical protein